MPKTFFILFFVSLCFVSPLLALEKGLEGKWNETLGAARKEGKVVVSGPPNAVVRLEVAEKFKERFGITVEYVDGGKQAGELVGPKAVELPVSIDFLGRPFSEPVLIRIAAAYERATCHRRPPKEFTGLPGALAQTGGTR